MSEIPNSKGERLLKTLDKRDKIGRGLELILVLFVLIINMYGLYQIQNIIKINQTAAVEARKQNVARQDELKGYVKCLSLLRFDHPELLNPDVTREQVSKALDECAKVQ